MTKFLPLSLLSFSFAAVAAAQEEIAVTPRIESVGVFKNGVAVVRASFPVEKPALLRWDRVPQVVHGTFQVENEGELAVRTTMQWVEETDDKELPNGTLQNDLAGKPVEVTLRATSDSPAQVLRGTVWDLPERTWKKRWDTDFTPLDPWSGRFARTPLQPEPAATTGSFLVLEDADGNREYLNSGNIQSLKVTGPFKPKTRKVEKPVMLFDARKIPAGSRITLSYLTKGLAWTPAYRVDLSDPAKLSIRQTAVIRNELMDLQDTEVQLISGFPNMAFAHVNSPLSPDGSLAGFFQQLAQQPGSANGVQSQMISYNSAAPNQIPAPDTAEKGNAGDDMHFESIGPRVLAAGDSLALEIAAGTAGYQRVVEWVIEDDRDEDGRYYSRNRERKPDDLDPWDAVKFANPLKFPMTTAPATLVENGKFRGQSMGKWVNPGQQVCLRITKALSVSTQYAEVEEEKQREENVRFSGSTYYRTKVTGTITLRNTRGKTAILNVRKQFSGEMIDATDKPRATLRTEGVRSVNPRRELEWDFELPAGQEKVITFRYSVLVPS